MKLKDESVRKEGDPGEQKITAYFPDRRLPSAVGQPDDRSYRGLFFNKTVKFFCIPGSERRTHACADSDAYAGTNAHAHAYAYAYTYADTYSNTYSNTYADTFSDVSSPGRRTASATNAAIRSRGFLTSSRRCRKACACAVPVRR